MLKCKVKQIDCYTSFYRLSAVTSITMIVYIFNLKTGTLHLAKHLFGKSNLIEFLYNPIFVCLRVCFFCCYYYYWI
jgi:fumarate reductase subunit C